MRAHMIILLLQWEMDRERIMCAPSCVRTRSNRKMSWRRVELVSVNVSRLLERRKKGRFFLLRLLLVFYYVSSCQRSRSYVYNTASVRCIVIYVFSWEGRFCCGGSCVNVYISLDPSMHACKRGQMKLQETFFLYSEGNWELWNNTRAFESALRIGEKSLHGCCYFLFLWICHAEILVQCGVELKCLDESRYV